LRGWATQALDRLHECEDLLDRRATMGIVGLNGWGYYSLGRASVLLGGLDEARRLGDRAIEFSPQHRGCTAHALHLLGDIATHPDRFDASRGEAHYREALALAEPRGMRPLVAHCHLGLGKLYRRTGKRTESDEHLEAATTMYRDMGMTYWLERAEREMKELASARRPRDRSGAQLHKEAPSMSTGRVLATAMLVVLIAVLSASSAVAASEGQMTWDGRP